MVLLDQVLDSKELEFIHKMAELLGLSEFEVLGLIDSYEEFKAPSFEFDRIVQFQRLVLAANLDDTVDSEERAVLEEAGLKLGLHRAAVDQVLHEMKKHPNGILPSEDLLKIFKVYHN